MQAINYERLGDELSNSTNICIKCQRPREEGGGCYTFCNGKNFLPIPEENPKHPGCRRRKLGR